MLFIEYPSCSTSVSYTHLVINRNGIADIIPLDLNEEEQKQFDASCKTMRENFELALTL